MAPKGFKKIVSIALLTVMTVELFFGGNASEASAEGEKPMLISTAANSSQASSTEEFSVERLTSNYTKVSANYTAKDYTGDAVTVKMDEAIKETSFLTADNYEYSNKVVAVKSNDTQQSIRM